MDTRKSTTAIAVAMGLTLALAAAGPAPAADQQGSGSGSATGTGTSSGMGSSGSGMTTTPRSQTQMQPGGASSVPGGISADDVIGRTVVNRQGDKVGKIEDLVVQPNKNEVHAVISIGGFLGMGDHDVVVPMKDLNVGRDNVTLMSQQSKEDLRTLPKYEENNWRSAPRGGSTMDSPGGSLAPASPTGTGSGTTRP